MPLRIMNLLESSRTIYPGTFVDELYLLEEIVSLVPEPEIISQANIEMPAHFTKLYNKCTRELDNDQKRRTKHLFIKYAALFLERDEDVGRTANDRHKIETGTHAPVKQPKAFAIPLA